MGGRPGYGVTLVTAARLGETPLSYVVASSGGPAAGDPATGVVGFIVSPSPYGTQAPSCADVVWRGASAVIVASSGGPAGTAVAIDSRGTVLSAAAELTAAASDLRAVVAPVASGDGGGEDPADAMAFGDAVRLWRKVLPRSTVFTMTPGRYAVSSDDANMASGDSSRGVHLYSAMPGAAVLAAASGTVALVLDGDAILDGLATDSTASVLAVAGSRVSAVSSSLSQVVVEGGTLRVDASSNVAMLKTAAGATTVGAGQAGAGTVSQVEVDDGDLSLDGVAAGASTSAVSLVGTGRVALLHGAALGGAAVTTAVPTTACGTQGADGSVSCTATCDRVHPHVRSPSCGGVGVTVADVATVTGVAGDVLTCGFRPWAPLIERKVVAPDGSATTAVDLDPTAPAPAPTVSATCETNR